ncbi:MAG: DEAD/DEAH box helicase family protein [Dehalococcoidia bacterium]|nr:DEAD/DEAH box helicase family protein [Dehalococcoidia bacterium]
MSESTDRSDTYLAAEARARVDIDKSLEAAGWAVQSRRDMNLFAGRGVAVREFTMQAGHGRADYLLFVDREVVGTIEAKPAGTTLTGVEEQSAKYGTGLPDGMRSRFERLPFIYESTGVETRFTNGLEPEPRSRRMFSFHRPETLAQWVAETETYPEAPTLRHRLRELPTLDERGLWPSQAMAVRNLERSLADNRPRALIQMATGSGKTFTAANIAYRLIKHARATRILFLVDRGNLGRQTLKEFQQFSTPDDGRKFTELYNVQHLTSNQFDPVAKVTISTIQRLYSMLRGEELEEVEDEKSAFEIEPARPVEVAYNPDVPIEAFDFVVVDECHRSIYGLWRQVLEYFDAHLIGLTATPSMQTFGFFNQNLVMQYDHAQAVADGVNVDFDVYRINTRITEQGSRVAAGEYVGFRERATRRERWEQLDEPLQYDASALDRAVLAKDQIRTVIQTFRDRLFTEIFAGRTEVPKTLIFAKDDSHADDIVQVVREEFGRGNEFAQKITYRTTEAKPEDLLAAFRNSFNPRIVVTVDMIATGTDIKPLECVFFMRATKSRTFFEQMKGRGVRVINDADFQAVTPDAESKTHFVIVDAVGVTESPLNDTQPLERARTISLQSLLNSVAAGQLTTDIVSSLASRLARLERQLPREERQEIEALAGVPLGVLTHLMVDSVDPDRQLEVARETTGKVDPSEKELAAAARALMEDATLPLAAYPELRRRIVDVRRSLEQTIDEVSKDEVLFAGPVGHERARQYVEGFRDFIREHRDEITALQLLYNVPWRQRPTFAEIRELARAIERTPERWTPEGLWHAFEALDRSKVHGSTRRVLTDLVSIVRYALDLSPDLVAYPDLVNERFEGWLAQQQQAGRDFNDEQLRWLAMVRDHIAASLAITADDFQYTPFSTHGGLGRAAQLFGGELGGLLEELNSELVA